RFDPAKGAPLEHYAWTRVSGAIMDELRRQDWAPRSLRRFERAADRAAEGLHAKNGCTPTEQEIAQALGMGVPDLREKREELEKVQLTSLNAPARGSDESLPIEVGETI